MKHCTALITSLVLLISGYGYANAQTPQDKFIYLPIVLKTPSCDFFEPNNTAAQATPLVSGETQSHCIIPAEDSDWFKFSIITKSQVTIELAGSSGDTELRLYDNSLVEIDLDYDSGVGTFSKITRRCGRGNNELSPGTYYARVEEWLNSEEIPAYTIYFSAVPCPVVSVLTNTNSYTTPGSLVVIGETKNDGVIDVQGINLTVNLFNSQNQLIDTNDAFVALANYSFDSGLPAGETSCFIVTFDQFVDWKYYEFESPTYYGAEPKSLKNVAVFGDSGGVVDSSTYRIIGFVRNDNNFVVSGVNVVGTLYDDHGRPINCNSTAVNSSTLAPGQSSSFEMLFYGIANYVKVDSYRLQVGN